MPRSILSLWWARRCGLPVELCVDNTDSEMLAHLGDRLRSRVKRLSVNVQSASASAADDAAGPSSAPRVTVLGSLLSLPNLQALAVEDEEQQDDGLVLAEVLGALKAAASLPVTVLQLDGWTALRDLSALPVSQYLRSLTVNSSGLRSLEGLCNYPQLETLSLSYCLDLRSVSGLAAVPRLHSVEILRCDLRSLNGLDGCLALTNVDVSGNRNLQSLSA